MTFKTFYKARNVELPTHVWGYLVVNPGELPAIEAYDAPALYPLHLDLSDMLCGYNAEDVEGLEDYDVIQVDLEIKGKYVQ